MANRSVFRANTVYGFSCRGHLDLYSLPKVFSGSPLSLTLSRKGRGEFKERTFGNRSNTTQPEEIIMKALGSVLLLAVMLIMPPAAGYGQEQSPNQATRASGDEVKKNSPSAWGPITDVIQAQKEKYQKDIQDQIQDKLKSVEDKFNGLKSLAGKAEPEKSAKQEAASTPAEAGKAGVGQKPAQAVTQTANSGSGFWEKLDALRAATMAFLKQLLAILFR
jgi:hypothetical protein